jgi:predicted MFS family arabinose efflux permease
VPVRERSRSLALVYSGMFIGSILGLGLSPQLIALLGWHSVFYIFGSLGVFWYMLWQRQAASTPADDDKLSSAEKVGACALCRVLGSAGCAVHPSDTPGSLHWRWPGCV